MFILQLNPMMGNYEALRPVMRSTNRQALIDFVESQKVEPYSDDDGLNMCGGKLSKSFQKGGPLEFLNPPDRDECIIDVGEKSDWMQQAAERFDAQVMSLPSL